MPRNEQFPAEINYLSETKVLSVDLENKSLADAFGQMDFYSKMLHSLAPNNAGVWELTTNSRMNAHIVGWPKEVNWVRVAAKKFEATIPAAFESYLTNFIEELKAALLGLKGAKSSPSSLMKATYNFSIKLGSELFEYHFLGRAREISALCVLFDLEPHPRNHLEVITAVTVQNTWPLEESSATPQRYYGDPSKTVDEFRNQGFPRRSDLEDDTVSPSLKIERQRYNGSLQEHYHLLTREQRREYQVGRSNIPNSIKQTLYATFNFTCNICHQTFGQEYLAPDHRIPAIVEADDLTRENFLDKLQTLCRSCNQVKREMCKKCPFSKNCQNCPWAFPERHSISASTVNQIFQIAKEKNISPNQFIQHLISLANRGED